MAFDDLNLEFEEDDNSNKPKKIEAVPDTTPAPEKRAGAGTGSIPSIPVAALKKSTAQSALKIAPETQSQNAEVQFLREQLKEADIKVALAEYKTEYLADMLSDLKLMEHQIGQLLVRIHAKHPDLKNEALMIKKILADFIVKKRK
jgi:hypothetical protein